MQNTTKSLRKPANKARGKLSKRMTFETLENRQVMAAEIFFDNSTGILYLEGTDTSRDSAIVRVDTKGTPSLADDQVVAG